MADYMIYYLLAILWRYSPEYVERYAKNVTDDLSEIQ